MTKFGKTASDSLDLLLDTMCSMFGAIILIAILVALLTQTSRSPASVGTNDPDLLRREIQIAEKDIVAAQEITRSADIDPAVATFISEERRLEEAIETARVESTRVKNEASLSKTDSDFSTKSKAFSESLQGIERDSGEVRNTLKAQAENTDRLQQRLNVLQQQVAQTKVQHQVKLRFPKEHAKTKDIVPVILKYDAVYPLVSAPSLERNVDNIRWEEEFLIEGHQAVPIKGKGYPPSALIPLLQTLNRNVAYLVFYVCDDSFDCFEQVKTVIANAGFEFGWEPISSSEHLRFGKNGHSPPPL
jgi:hypothetical protein